MANQTITSNTNHDAATGRAAGEDFTITSGAILTIDSMPHVTAMGILGDITCSDGVVFIDARFVRNVAYSSGSGGSLPAVGATITWDSGTHQGKVIRQLSGDATSGVLVVTVRSTGTYPDEVMDPIVSADTITDGTWSATVDSVVVGYLIVFGEDQDWSFADARCTFRTRAAWYQVGVGDGTDSQTMELPHVGHQHALWVESSVLESGTVTTADSTGETLTDSAATFVTNKVHEGFAIVRNATDGSTARVMEVVSETELTLEGLAGGSDDGFSIGDTYTVQSGVYLDDLDGVFQIWHRIASGTSTDYFYQFSEFGSTQEIGHVFQQSTGDATVTFGTTTQGGVPGNGARVVIQNIHAGTTSVGAPATESSSTAIADYAQLTGGGGVFDIQGVNFSTTRLLLTNTGAASLRDCGWGLSSVGSNAALSGMVAPLLISNCAWSCPGNITGGIPVATLSTGVRAIGGTIIEDTVIYAGGTSYPQMALSIGGSKNVTVERCKVCNASKTGSVALQIDNNSNDINIRHSVVTGISYIATGAFDVSISGYRFGFPPGQVTRSGTLLAISGASGVLCDKVELIEGCALSTSYWGYADYSSDITIRRFGAIDAKADFGGVMSGFYISRYNHTASGIKLQQIWSTNSASRAVMVDAVSAEIEISNVSADYSDGITLAGISASIVRGYHGGSAGLDVTNGIEGDLTNTNGVCFLDAPTSDTAGLIVLLFSPPGAAFADYVTTTGGDPAFTGLGTLLLREVGDQVTYEWPWLIMGYTGFSNTTPLYAGTNTANVTYEYDLDTGAGYSGEWTTCSGANLSAETISPSGFRIKFRITCSTASSSNVLKGFAVITTTTIADQANNLYKLNETAVTVRVVDTNTLSPIVGAAVYVEAASGGEYTLGTELAEGTTDAAGEVDFTLSHDAAQAIRGVARKSSATPFYTQGVISSTITPGVDSIITVALVRED